MNVVIVTGASKGLGLSISRKLIQEKYYVVGIGRTLSKGFDDLDKKLSRFYSYDLTDIDGIYKLIKEIIINHKEIYGLVNNAAIGLDGVLATQHKNDIRKLLSLNIESPITISKYVIRNMIKNRNGKIVNISSIIASTGFNGLSVYAATKSAIEGFSRSLSRELGKVNINVNCVAPGYMLTNMTAGIEKNKLETIKKRSPLGLAEVDDVANTVLFLLSEKSNKITGTILTVDGGSSS
jgi:3-oxoacyl-[acyl-carrier protein] reductase